MYLLFLTLKIFDYDYFSTLNFSYCNKSLEVVLLTTFHSLNLSYYNSTLEFEFILLQQNSRSSSS